MRVSVNHDTCIASGNCGQIAPNVFRNLAEYGGFVSLVTDRPSESEWEAVRRAERLCPSATVRIEEDVGRGGTGP